MDFGSEQYFSTEGQESDEIVRRHTATDCPALIRSNGPFVMTLIIQLNVTQDVH